MKKITYAFEEGRASEKDLLGGKGANLCEMTRMKLPVPPGFIITTQYCNYFLKGKKHHPKFKQELERRILELEKKTGKTFGGTVNPLLISVRSGSKFSMPGMMDTILNLGLNRKTVKTFAKETRNARFAYDAYRRFIQMFGKTVLGIPGDGFENVLQNYKKRKHYQSDIDMDEEDWKLIARKFERLIKKFSGKELPEDPRDQLALSIIAVFRSWNNKRAITYRNLNKIPHTLGTAVNIQAMVFGNLGPTSGTGVAFTRNPVTGEKSPFGEYLMNAQGEDVVAGIRTPLKLNKLSRENPRIFRELIVCFRKLEKHFRDMQDIEFTIEKGKLFMLQTRTGKRTALASLKIATDMRNEQLITRREAIMRVAPESLDQLLHPVFDYRIQKKVLTKGLPASPGAASGRVVFTAEDALERKQKNNWPVILIRHETSPDDIQGMQIAEAVLTSCGGMTSHAAVVARGMGKCCVVGAHEISVDYKKKRCEVKKTIVREGDWISIDGTTGEVMLGDLEKVLPEPGDAFKKFLSWADAERKLKVFTNADTPKDAATARKFGAEGIGLCRTEHMFFHPERLVWVQAMIVAGNEKKRKQALKKLLPFQTRDFVEIFRAMDGLPVIIRLLDPPLHEFLPKLDQKKELALLSRKSGLSTRKLKQVITTLHEANPMLGHRGCRLSITYPEIAVMQTEAIIQAALECQRKNISVRPEIMIPLTAMETEYRHVEKIIRDTASAILNKSKKKLKYLVGTMIEIPRACLVADKIAKHAEFFSFGTNDLTQMGFGLSRDDSARFLPAYVEKNIFSSDPFLSLDKEGIGELMKIAVKRGRSSRRKLEIGICGEHGGDPESIHFCHDLKLNYVSCSPFRVPIARLAAAQAALEKGPKDGKIRHRSDV